MMKYFIILLMGIICVSCGKNTTAENYDTNSHNKVILALGDSLTEGYGVEKDVNYPSILEKKLQEEGYSYTITNAGKSGDTSEDLVKRAAQYIDIHPEVVILVIGGNDGLRKLPTPQMQENISQVIELYQAGGSKIILSGVDISILHGLGYRKEFLQVYENLSKQYPNVYFLKSFLAGVVARTELNIQDGIHPNAAGYEIISSNIYTFLEKQKILEK